MLKEISYIHTEAFAAGELKHGTIALIEPGTPVIAVISQEKLYEKMLSNIQEVKARGAYTIAIAKEGIDESLNHADKTIYIPKVDDIFAPVLTVVPTQLLAYCLSFKLNPFFAAIIFATSPLVIAFCLDFKSS